MKKALTLTLTACEELPTPLSVRLLCPGLAQTLALSFRKGEEVPADLPLKLEFLYAGEVIGFVTFLPCVQDTEEIRWLPVGFPEREMQWSDLETEPTGPRVQISLQPVRPLSPIMEMTEASECSLVDPAICTSGRVSPNEDLRAIIDDLQREREVLGSKHKDLQLRVMELQQALVKDRWRAKMDIEQLDQRHKAEVGHLVIVLDKLKAAQKRDAAMVEELRGKLNAVEGRHQEQEGKLAAAKGLVQQKEEELKTAAGTLSTIQSLNSGLETRLAAAQSEIRMLKEEAKENVAIVQALQEELGNRRLTTPDTRKSTPSTDKKHSKASIESDLQQILDLKQSISSLQSALAASHEETDRKDKEIRQLSNQLEAFRTRPRALQELPAECTVPDMVDDLLRDYAQSHQLTVPFVKVSEGVYTVGSKRVNVTVRNGVPVIRVGGGFMFVEEFVKMYGPVERLVTPKRLFTQGRGSRKSSQDLRARSIGADTQRHHRSVTAGGDLGGNWQAESTVSQRLDTENSCDYGNVTEREPMQIQKARGREMSPRPVYWRETISSHNKMTSKGVQGRNEAARFQILRG
jgi:hypothetical protein